MLTISLETEPHNGTLIATINAWDALERRRVHIQRIAGNVGDVLDTCVGWGVEAVVHRSCETKRHISAIAIGRDQFGVLNQIG